MQLVVLSTKLTGVSIWQQGNLDPPSDYDPILVNGSNVLAVVYTQIAGSVIGSMWSYIVKKKSSLHEREKLWLFSQTTFIFALVYTFIWLQVLNFLPY